MFFESAEEWCQEQSSIGNESRNARPRNTTPYFMGHLKLNQVWTFASFSRFESRFYRFGLAFQLPLPFLVRFLTTTSAIAAPTRLSKSKSILSVLGRDALRSCEDLPAIFPVSTDAV